MPPAPLHWWVIVPVKDPRTGKTRLRAPHGVDRERLTRAIALDTLEAVGAAVGADHLVVVTDAPDLCPSGSVLVPDPGWGLNAAVRAGVAAVRNQAHPGDGAAAVAVLLGDHPALRPQDLQIALGLCSAHRDAIVPDADGTGTALLTALDPSTLVPRFGRGSAAAHARSASLVTGAPDGVTIDVDDAAALERARSIGLGRHTVAALDLAPH